MLARSPIRKTAGRLTAVWNAWFSSSRRDGPNTFRGVPNGTVKQAIPAQSALALGAITCRR